MSLNGINKLRYEIIEAKIIPGKLYLWDEFAKMLNIPISTNGYIARRNGVISCMNNHARIERANWRLMVKPRSGVIQIVDRELVPNVIIHSMKKIRNAHLTGKQRVDALAETMDLLPEGRKQAEKAAILFDAGLDLLESGFNRSPILKPIKQLMG